MKLKRLAQSTILLTNKAGSALLIDPGKYNLDPGKLTVDTFPSADVVVVTHKHADHFDLPLLNRMLKKRSSIIITNNEIAGILQKNGIAATTVEAGTKISECGFELTAIATDHVVRGEYIINFGLVVCADGVSLYHTSDTRYIDPSLLPEETHADYLLLPISNRGVVMGIDDALVFASELRPKVVIPLHYDSPKDASRVDPHEFAEKASKVGLDPRVMIFGEEIEL